jgi:hypothetical protein
VVHLKTRKAAWAMMKMTPRRAQCGTVTMAGIVVATLSACAATTGLAGVVHNSASQQVRCMGIFTAEEFPLECSCGGDCHTCDNYTPGTATEHVAFNSCTRCRGGKLLLRGRCVSELECVSAGGAPLGEGSFDRKCEGAAAPVTTQQALSSSATASVQPAGDEWSAPLHKATEVQDGCHKTMTGTLCMCSQHALAACVGKGCASSWTRGSFGVNGAPAIAPEYRVGYDPSSCPECRCVLVANIEGNGAHQAQVRGGLCPQWHLAPLARTLEIIHTALLFGHRSNIEHWPCILAILFHAQDSVVVGHATLTALLMAKCDHDMKAVHMR